MQINYILNRKLLTMYLNFRLVNMIYIVLLLQNFEKIFVYIWKKIGNIRNILVILYKNS